MQVVSTHARLLPRRSTWWLRLFCDFCSFDNIVLLDLLLVLLFHDDELILIFAELIDLALLGISIIMHCAIRYLRLDDHGLRIELRAEGHMNPGDNHQSTHNVRLAAAPSNPSSVSNGTGQIVLPCKLSGFETDSTSTDTHFQASPRSANGLRPSPEVISAASIVEESFGSGGNPAALTTCIRVRND